MINTRRTPSRWIGLTVAAALAASACTCIGNLIPGSQSTPAVPTLPGPVSPGGETQPTPIFAPTARPLAEVADEPGVYRNEVLGVSLEYPVEWSRGEADEASGVYLFVEHPPQPLILYLRSEIMLEGVDFKQAAQGYFDQVASDLGLTGTNLLETLPNYTLGDGTPAWRSVGEGIYPGGSTLRYDVTASPRGNRAFILIFLASPDAYSASESTLDEISQSLRVYTPRPYGVDRENALFLAGEEPETLDPALWRSGADGIVGDLFSGLVELDTNLQPVPDLAESWDVSGDGTVYTFHLRRNVTFHNGKPFTAADVIFSWERACNPATGSDTAATYLGDIVGVPEVIAGEATEISGLRVIDDFTLEVTLDGPKAYFLAKLAYPTSWVVDQETVDQIEESPNGTGPFMLVRHVENEVIIVARNPHYHRGFVPLEYIVYLLYPGPLVRVYEAGEIDMAFITEDLLPRAHDSQDPLYGTVEATSELCTWYAVFDASRPPFDDPLVRLAFADAVDRERYVDVVSEGTGVVAQGLYPPGLPGFNPDLEPLPYDPEGALGLLQQSSYGGAAGLPEIVFTASGAGMDIPPSVALLVQMWQEALGVTVRVEQLDSQSFYDQIYAGNHGQIILTGWCADYPDPENFADLLFHTGSPQNHGDYSNPDLDALLEQARVEADIPTRMALYQEIEHRIVGEAPAVFLQHSSVYYAVVKPYVQGYVSTPIGVAQHMNLWIQRQE